MVRAVPLTLILFAIAEAQSPGDAARSFLVAAFDATRDDLDRLNQGQVVARTLDTSHKREVATLGMVRIKTTPEFYVEQLTDITTFKKDEAILQIGAFSTPPRPSDIADLTLDEGDIRRLRGCRVGDCDVQLSADAIERFGTKVNWRAADVEQQATSVMRDILVEYVTRYLEIGPLATMEYADTPTPLNLAQEFAALMEADAGIWREIPALRQHLIEFPNVSTDAAVDVVYWSKERVNRRPVISVTHMAILPAENDSPVAYAVASKQLYGMHYFDASLGLTLLIPDPAASTATTYVVYLNRSRIDLFDGVFGGIARKLVSSRARALVSEQLAQVRRTLEPQFVAAQGQ
jgi:hypothetical protein